jgi:glycosyltransferase involved in cell wall biosynthesis
MRNIRMSAERDEKDSTLSISVIIPTLNAQSTLEGCLLSLEKQRYSGAVQVIIADGGSTDSTLEIASRHGCVVVDNPGRTGEAGKAAGLKAASGDVVALVDSDNILPDEHWLQSMVQPFTDPLISGTEPIRFTYRRTDPALTRYCAMMGMNDPLCYFLKNYDRINALSETWTGLNVETTGRDGYLEVHLEPGLIPTIGANGFLVRKTLLDELEIGDYLFDIDVVHQLVERGHNRFAKVDAGIIHLYGRGLSAFARKQLRRVRDFRYYGSLGIRRYPWSRQKRTGLVKFVIYCLLVFPLIAQAARGYARKPDVAWALHAPACIITLFVYGWGFIEGSFKPRQQERTGWKQS